MRHDAVDTLAQCVECPKCKRTMSVGYYGRQQFRYCLYCYLYCPVFYDKRRGVYKLGKRGDLLAWLNES